MNLLNAFPSSLTFSQQIVILIRIVLATACGSLVGLERSRRLKGAGIRTHSLVACAAALLMIVSKYGFTDLEQAGVFFPGTRGADPARIAAQVVSGVSFLGAGIIIKVAHQQVSGLTTATGLFATVCMGLACGAGFYELVLITLLLIVVVLNVMAPLEILFKRRLRNITLNVEFTELADVQAITEVIQAQAARIYDIDVERTERSGNKWPSAIFILQLSKENHSHSGMLSAVAELNCVRSVQELIA